MRGIENIVIKTLADITNQDMAYEDVFICIFVKIRLKFVMLRKCSNRTGVRMKSLHKSPTRIVHIDLSRYILTSNSQLL